VISIIKGSSFWNGVKSIKELLTPLAACVDASQSNETDLSTGTIIFIFLFNWFKKKSNSYMIERLEKRWIAMNVEVYIRE
jgi:hypothetical protein